MGLRLKFNLILVAIFLAGFATVGGIAHRYLQTQALEDAKRAANLVLDASSIANIDARLATALGSRIIEMRVREYSAQETQSGLEADVVLKNYFLANESRIESWFNVISPISSNLGLLQKELLTLREKDWKKIYGL